MTEAARRQIRAATLVWMASVALSRVAGLLREMVIARAAGATGQTDVYFSAFTLPDAINYLLAGGAFSITLIPIFTFYLTKDLEEEAWRAFWSVFTVISAVLILLLGLAWFFARPLCGFLSSGFSGEQQALLVRLTRILLPAQVFFFMGGILGAAQMARGQHAFYALSPLVYNAGIIAGGLLLAASMGMEGFCWGALFGAFIGHGLLQVLGARRVGLKAPPWWTRAHPALGTYFRMTLPIMLGFSIVVVDDWLARYFGSHLSEASISWLNYAKKLALLVPAILGQALAAASFPTLSRQVETGNLPDMSATLREGLVRALLLSSFGSVLFIVLNREVPLLAFGSGRFSVTDALTTGRALAVLALAVPAWVAQAILARGFYALRDTWAPTLLGTAVTVLALPVYGVLCQVFERRGEGYLGLAWAGTGSMVVYASWLHFALERKLRKRETGLSLLNDPHRLIRGIALVIACLIVCAIARGVAGSVWSEAEWVQALLRCAVVGAVGLFFFVKAGSWLGLSSVIGLDSLGSSLFRRITGRP